MQLLIKGFSVHFSELSLIAFPKMETRFFGTWNNIGLSIRKQQAVNTLYHKTPKNS